MKRRLSLALTLEDGAVAVDDIAVVVLEFGKSMGLEIPCWERNRIGKKEFFCTS